MYLGVNGFRLLGPRAGVGRYIEHLLRYWAESQHPFDQIRVYTPGPIDLPLPLNSVVWWHPLPSRLPDSMWEQITLPWSKPPDDLFFCPSYVAPLLGSRRPLVVTHLGSYEALPWAFPFWQRTKARYVYQASCHRADIVITVSESSKRDIMRFYNLPESRIKVIPLGVDDAFRPLAEGSRLTNRRRSYFADGRPYLLFVGKLSHRRRIPELLRAFARLKQRRLIPHGLVLIGPHTTGQRVEVQATELGIIEDVVHRPFAEHPELIEAYNAADLFVYPSEYEGFGIPVLEAMACGTPTVTLDNSAFPEFAGGIAYFARDGSVEALEEAIEIVLFSSEIRARTLREGPGRADQYRWKDIARHTMDLLSAVARR